MGRGTRAGWRTAGLYMNQTGARTRLREVWKGVGGGRKIFLRLIMIMMMMMMMNQRLVMCSTSVLLEADARWLVVAGGGVC
jgi:hypothetical protein